MSEYAPRPARPPASRHLRRLAGVALAAASLLPAGCGGAPAGGDPGGKRLKELSADAVFAAVPETATMVRMTKTPARYRQPGFSGGGWDGPSVAVTFRSSAPPADVYGFYAQQAEAAGWRPTAGGSLGLTDRWAKTYPDGASATLLLGPASSPAGAERAYRLAGGVAPVTH